MKSHNSTGIHEICTKYLKGNNKITELRTINYEHLILNTKAIYFIL